MSENSLPDPSAMASLALLDKQPPFALRDAMASASIRTVPRGARIFHQGESAERVHALLSGCVRISQTGSDGGQVLLRFIGPGDIFGDAAINANHQYPADATALVRSVAASWSRSAMRALMDQHSGIAINMIRILGHRLADLQDRVREFATHRTDRRVAHTLLRLLHQAGRPVSGGTEIGFPLRRKDIAEMSGTTLYTVSRILTGWERNGLLASRNQRLVIYSLGRIRQIAENGNG